MTEGKIDGSIFGDSAMITELTPDEEQFAALFFDGDGCVSVSKSWLLNADTNRPAPAVTFTQAYNSGIPPELLHMERIFGGSLAMTRTRTETRRDQWCLRLPAEGARRLLSIVARHGVVKDRQARVVLDYYDGRGDLKSLACALFELKATYQDVNIDHKKLTAPALAGLFSAEGSVGMYKQKRGHELRATIGQSSCKQLLRAIVEVLGYGSVSGCVAMFCCAQAVRFLRHILPYLPRSCQKYDQVILALSFTETRTSNQSGRKKRTPEQVEHMEQTAKRLKELKKL